MDDHQRNIDQADNRYTGPETDGQYAPVPGFVQVHNQYTGNVCKKFSRICRILLKFFSEQEKKFREARCLYAKKRQEITASLRSIVESGLIDV